MKMSGDTIESLIRERRKTEKESKLLQAQIDRLEAERLEKDNAGALEELNSQIEELSFENQCRGLIPVMYRRYSAAASCLGLLDTTPR